MTTLEGITDTAAVAGLKAVEDTATATLVAIERAYEAAMAHVAELATNRVRVMAPSVVVVPHSVVAAPPAPVVEVPVVEVPVVEVPVVEVPVVEVPVVEVPVEAHVEHEIEAEAPIEAEIETPVEAQIEIEVEAAADVAAEAAPEVAPEPRVSPLVEALQALQGVEVRAEVTPEPQPTPLTDVFPVVEVIERPRLVDAVWIAGRHAEAKTDQIPVQAA
ncbi:hypothetical protein [Modestobacter sp. DSM 44400]|uniref:hypothetical protein n=1 Tax=Modestobacter sp. DSM 44400 TaxID=1550230 RepID=UPI000AA8B304|nr:hypothetical protein [Modestobacter sp. DSM 44400]